MAHVRWICWQRVILDQRESKANIKKRVKVYSNDDNEIRTCIVALRRNGSPFLVFLCEQHNNSRIPFRKFLLKNAYSKGFIAELKYETKNVNGVNRALKFEAPS